jgi:hypothetical protein
MSARKRREQLDNSFFDASNTDNLPTLDIREVDDVGFGGLALPVVRRQDGTVKLGNFRLTMTGLVVEGRISQEEWWAFFEGVQKIESTIQFIIGDLAIYGEEEFRISYEEIAARTGYKKETVENYAYVARNMPQALRSDKLSFNHHYLVASLATDAEKQQWLATAQEHDLSVRNLELALNIWREGGDPQHVFGIIEEKPSPVQQARLKSVRERSAVLKKARSKKARKQWLHYAKEQAEAWAEIAGKIEDLDEE